MRFLADGPSLPDELLEARDQGTVVFFCGAGVSLPAGLPSFLRLSQLVIEKLGAPADAPSRMLLERVLRDPQFAPPLDQIFHQLRYEYGVEYIDQVTSELLDPPSEASSEQHAIVLRLSRSAEGQPQVVTTNFDLLFERADPSLVTHVAPALPNLSIGPPLEGLVYLHGRRDGGGGGRASRQPSSLVLSSADFGRAYLSEGWATSFVTHLLRRYIIVLLGYSAGDPPVRYLLEGLHSRGEESPARIYAFDQGSADAVQERWRDRGVRALAYPKSDAQHSALWDTLRRWADRADDPSRWQRSILELAAQDPKSLPAYQRGQVASLVQTDSGAKLFRESDPPPPAEWLCVFDRNVRYSAPYKPYGEEREIDTLTCYGLDDDPPRPAASDRQFRAVGHDFLSMSATSDERAQHPTRLAASSAYHIEPLTSRLFHLSHWMIRLLDDPATVWWAAGYEALHPRLLELIKWQLARSTSPHAQLAYRAWTLMLEKFRDYSDGTLRDRWFDFVPRQKKEGWTAQTLREFERATQPYLTAKRPNFGRGIPPLSSWEKLRLSEVVDFDVQFSQRDPEKLSIPSEVLPEIIRIMRRGLERAARLLADIDISFWRTTTFIPEGSGEGVHPDAVDVHVLWFVRLFDRLTTEQPDRAGEELKRWPAEEPFFFDKLRIYAWMKRGLVAGSDVAAGMLGLTDKTFWNLYHRRELLHTLAARWGDLDAGARAAIEGRVIAGSSRWREEDAHKYAARRAMEAATLLGWLQSHGCELSEATRELLPKLRATDPRWQPAWDAEADEASGPRVSSVRVDADPSSIIDAPLNEVIARATENSRREFRESTEYDPFQGLVRKRPQRALAALTREARRGVYPVAFWQTLLSRAPEDISQRLRWIIARRAVRLPTNVVQELRHALSDWFRTHLSKLAEESLEEALKLWDAVLDQFFAAGDAATASALGETFFAGEPQHRSRRTSEHALNSPVGRITDKLLDLLGDSAPSPGAGIPVEFRSRLERLLTAPREPRDHAICEMALRLTWLHQVDPQWTQENLFTRLDPSGEDAEPMWSGYSYDSYQASPAMFGRIKAHFLQVFGWLPKWRWDDAALRHFAEQLVIYSFRNTNGGAYLTFDEARSALQSADDTVRSHAAWMLTRIVRDQGVWPAFGRPFVERAWPRERRFQSAATSNQLAELARASYENFPDAVAAILPLLVPVEHADFLLHEITESASGEGADAKLVTRFPEAVLALIDRLVARDSRAPIYGLGPAVHSIAEALPRLRQDARWRRLNEIATRG
jgi:hypothetical protein